MIWLRFGAISSCFVISHFVSYMKDSNGLVFYRYLLYGDISTKAAHMLALPKVADFFARLIQRVAPKSYQQAAGEVFVTRKFLENFCGDQVRFLARSFAIPGNHLGQQSHGYRWPYGPVRHSS
jgi:1-pyrroline-5-carboxylate dehydrogenase